MWGLRSYFQVANTSTSRFIYFASYEYCFQNLLNFNSWQHSIEGGREFKTMGIIRIGGGGWERDTSNHQIKGWIHSGAKNCQIVPCMICSLPCAPKQYGFLPRKIITMIFWLYTISWIWVLFSIQRNNWFYYYKKNSQ